MAKYRKKPIEVEAVQYIRPPAPHGVFIDETGKASVVTIHGHRTPVNPGDWIITEPDGVHHYPCKPEVFAATYEPAD